MDLHVKVDTADKIRPSLDPMRVCFIANTVAHSRVPKYSEDQLGLHTTEIGKVFFHKIYKFEAPKRKSRFHRLSALLRFPAA